MANGAAALSGAASGAIAGSQILPGWGTAIGAVVGGIGGLLKKDAKAPQQAVYKDVDPTAVAKGNIAGNLANLPGAQTLSSGINSFNQSQATALMEQAMPGFGALQKRMLAEVNSDLDSQNSLPPEMQAQISRFAAEKGVSRGTSGNFNGFNLVKDFGFNLVDWKNASRARALNTLSSVYGMTPRVNPMSPMASLVDTGAALGTAAQNNQMRFNSQQAGFNAQAAAANYNAMATNGYIDNMMGSLGKVAGTLGTSGVQSKVAPSQDVWGNPTTMTPYTVKG